MIRRWLTSWLGRYLDDEIAGLKRKVRRLRRENRELRIARNDLERAEQTRTDERDLSRVQHAEERELLKRAIAERDWFRDAANVQAGELQDLRDELAKVRGERDDALELVDRMGVQLAYALERLGLYEPVPVAVDGRART